MADEIEIPEGPVLPENPIIFWNNKVVPNFIAKNGMHVNPVDCTLEDKREGYYLPYDLEWKETVESQGAITEALPHSDISFPPMPKHQSE